MGELASFSKYGSIAVVTFNHPPVNALAHAPRVALWEALAAAQADDAVQAILIACEGRTFIAGADIAEFDAPRDPDVFELVEYVGASTKPVTAALHGTPLGGGLELALACHYRVAARDTKMGFPEVALGILPGAGGTQRLPRLVGVRQALDLIVNGTLISAERARTIGLVDEIVEGDLRAGAMSFVERKLAEGTPLPVVAHRVAAPEASGFFEEYEREVAASRRGLIAPLRCIEAVRAAVELPFDEGLKRERELFRELVKSPQSKGQRHAFFGEREVARSPRIPRDARAAPVRSVVVVGANPTAAGIAMCVADAGVPVAIHCQTPGESAHGEDLVRRLYAATKGRDEAGKAEAEREVRGIRHAVGFDDLEGVGLVVVSLHGEAARAAVRALDAAIGSDAVVAIASNTDLNDIVTSTKRPEQVVGMRFGDPRHPTRLLEVLGGPQTGSEAAATAMGVGKSLGRVTVFERESACSAGDRLVDAYFREALLLLEAGALPDQVDRALHDFGFGLGPLDAIDGEGLEVTRARRKAVARGERVSLLDELCESGRLGRSSGVGFHRYDPQGHPISDPALEETLTRHSDRRGISRRKIDDAEIVDRCCLSLIEEGARLIEEGVLARPLEVDMICIHGHGFPVHRGGPLFHADRVGLATLYERVRGSSAAERPPPDPLVRMLDTGRGFYG